MKNLILIIIMVSLFSRTMAQNYRSAEEAKGLMPGSVAPDFSAVDQHGNIFNLGNALKQSVVVIVFYRGNWCPVCNKHLKTLQDSLEMITGLGVKVVAVSPEKPEYLTKMEEKTGAKFPLLYDEDYKIADAYDVTFRPDEKTLFIYNTFLDANLKTTHSDASQQLPVPATYLVSSEGLIFWRQFNPDYHKRSTVSAIVNAIHQLQNVKP